MSLAHANFERECIEEVCNPEELFEATGHDNLPNQILHLNQLCKSCFDRDREDKCHSIGTQNCVNIYGGFSCQCRAKWAGDNCGTFRRLRGNQIEESSTTVSGSGDASESETSEKDSTQPGKTSDLEDPNSTSSDSKDKCVDKNFPTATNFCQNCYLTNRDNMLRYCSIPKQTTMDIQSKDFKFFYPNSCSSVAIYQFCQKTCRQVREEFLQQAVEKLKKMKSNTLEENGIFYDKNLPYRICQIQDKKKKDGQDDKNGKITKTKKCYPFFHHQSSECPHTSDLAKAVANKKKTINSMTVEEFYDKNLYQKNLETKKSHKGVYIVVHILLVVLVVGIIFYWNIVGI